MRMHGGAHLHVTEERGRAVGALPGVGLPGVVGWVGRAQGEVWGWAGLGWVHDGVMGMR